MIKNIIHILSCFLLIGFCQLHAQNIDSLFKVYSSVNLADTCRLNALDKIVDVYRNTKPDTAIILAEKELKFANALPSNKGKKWTANAFFNIGESHINSGNYPKAAEFYLKALQLNEETGDKKAISDCLHSVGLAFWYQSNYPKALEFYLKALRIREEIKDIKGIGNSLSNIGIVYLYQSDYKNAQQYYLKALKLYEESNNQRGIGACYINIGMVYSERPNPDYPKALACYLKAIPILEKIGDTDFIGNCYANIGAVYEHQSNYPKALESHLKSLQLKRKIGDKQSIGIAYSNIGQLYIDLQKYDKAIQYEDSSLQISKEIGDINTQRAVYQNLAMAYSKTSNFKEAYENHIKFKALTDSIFNADNSKQLGDMKTKFEVEKKETELKAKADAEQVISAEEKKRQQFIIYAVVGVLLIVIIFSALLYKRFRLTHKQKEIIEVKSRETEEQKHLVEEKQKEIIDSITYAKRLQQAILPSDEEIKKYLPDYFIYYKPKDIIAGDFYWLHVTDTAAKQSKNDNIIFIAAADSTGHGVPGAMVSVVCSNALNRAVKEFNLRDTGKILDKTRELVLETFEKSGEEIKDGMDISLLAIDKNKQQIFWSGANNQLWYICNNQLIEIKADKQAIGKTDNPKPFTTHTIELKTGDIFYLMTDGYADQFGGNKGKKFKYKQLEETLLVNSNRSLEEQKNVLSQTFRDWMGNLEQVDDITIIGIKI